MEAVLLWPEMAPAILLFLLPLVSSKISDVATLGRKVYGRGSRQKLLKGQTPGLFWTWVCGGFAPLGWAPIWEKNQDDHILELECKKTLQFNRTETETIQETNHIIHEAAGQEGSKTPNHEAAVEEGSKHQITIVKKSTLTKLSTLLNIVKVVNKLSRLSN